MAGARTGPDKLLAVVTRLAVAARSRTPEVVAHGRTGVLRPRHLSNAESSARAAERQRATASTAATSHPTATKLTSML
jgi:hypothetical protein